MTNLPKSIEEEFDKASIPCKESIRLYKGITESFCNICGYDPDQMKEFIKRAISVSLNDAKERLLEAMPSKEEIVEWHKRECNDSCSICHAVKHHEQYRKKMLEAIGRTFKSLEE